MSTIQTIYILLHAYATELNLKMAVFLKFNWAYGASKNNEHYQLHWSTSGFETDRYDSIDMSILYSVFIPSLQLLYYIVSLLAKVLWQNILT